MPVLPVSVIEPIWDQFAVLLPEHPGVDPAHPLGCHRRRVLDRIVGKWGPTMVWYRSGMNACLAIPPLPVPPKRRRHTA